jgi:hypothetical protein
LSKRFGLEGKLVFYAFIDSRKSHCDVAYCVLPGQVLSHSGMDWGKLR